MAKQIPVKIWVAKHRPSSDPKFHIKEILAGVGNSIREVLTILSKGSFFIGEYINFSLFI